MTVVLPIDLPRQQLPQPTDRLSDGFLHALPAPVGLWTPSKLALAAADFTPLPQKHFGALNGGITTVPGGFGVLGAARKFDGSTGVIPVGNIHASPIFLWAVINPSIVGTADGNYRTIIAKRDGSTNATEYGFDIDLSGKLRFYLNNAGFQIWIATTVLTAGKWYLVAAAYNGAANPVFFVNGLTDAISTSATPVAVLQNSISTAIGWFVNATPPDHPFQGQIAAAGIHQAYPTAGQVSSLYSCLLTGKPFPLFQPQTTELFAGAAAAATSAPGWFIGGGMGSFIGCG